MHELGVVYRNIRRADGDVAAKLGALGTATVHEAMGTAGPDEALYAPGLCRAHGPPAPP